MEGEFVSYNLVDVAKCPSCGADMHYDIATGNLKCDYCDGSISIVRRVAFLRDYEAEKSKGSIVEDKQEYQCPNCGAKVNLAAFETAKKCPFCGATNIIKFEDLKGMKPDSLLPFSLTQDDAANVGKKWMKKKIFAPTKLRKGFTIENFKGIYFPSFGFNANTVTKYDGRFGEKKTRTVGTGDNKHTETYIEWFKVSGTYRRSFENVMVEASTQLTQKELNKILPYDMENIEGYNKDYLAGFSAERYDTPIEYCYSTAKAQMENTIRKGIIAQYPNADVVDYLNMYPEFSNKKFRYSLLPLWICGYNFKEKAYRFIINARNGKSVGKVPVSPLKITFFVLGVLAAVALIIVLNLLNEIK